jgi:hypothetical protein
MPNPLGTLVTLLARPLMRVCFVLSRTCLAYTVNVYALSCPCELCFGSHSFNHFLSSIIVEILDVTTSQADQVHVGLHVGVEPCLTFWQIQFLDQISFRQNSKCFVDCGKTDCWMNFLDFIVDSPRTRMISAVKHESTDRYPLRSGLVPLVTQSFDYRYF